MSPRRKPTSDRAPAAKSGSGPASSEAAGWARVATFVCVALAAGILAAWFGSISSGQPAPPGTHVSYFLGFAVTALSAWIVGRSRRAYLTELNRLNETIERVRSEALEGGRVQHLHREMMEDVGVGWYRMAPDGQMETANLALAFILGYDSVEDLLSACKGTAFTGATDRIAALNALQSVGEIRHHEAGWPSAQGRRIRLLESARTVRDDAGRQRHIEGVALPASAADMADQRVRDPQTLESALERIRELEEDGDEFGPSETDADATAKPRAVNVRDLVEYTLESASPLAADRELELVYRLHPDVPRAIEGDPERLRQALQNLIDFSVRHAGRGTVELNTTMAVGFAGSIIARFEFHVTKAAVAPPELQRVFESAAENPRSGVERNAGNLAVGIGRRLVEQLGGSLRLEYTSDGGFVLFANVPTTALDERSKDGTELAGTDILVVDDHVDSRAFLTYLLESAGATVRAVDEPSAVAGSEDWNRPEVIVASLSSAQGASALVGHLRNVEAAHRPPLILVVPSDLNSGKGRDRSGSQLVKPVGRDDLVRTVRNALEARSRRSKRATSERSPGVATGRSILVAEDDAVTGKLVGHLLEGMGFDVALVTTGDQAVDAFRGRQFDAALLDIRMPGLSGPEAAREILRELRPSVTRPILLGMTASALPEDHEDCLAAGMHQCLLKPLSADMLRDALESGRMEAGAGSGGADRPPVPRRETVTGSDGIAPPTRRNDTVARTGVGTRSMDEIRAHLEAQHGNEPHVMVELITVFLRGAPDLIRAMTEHLGSGEFASVRSAAQRLKSSCRLIGFSRMAAMCRALEMAATDEVDARTLEPLVKAVRDTYEDVKRYLDAERSELQHLASLQSNT